MALFSFHVGRELGNTVVEDGKRARIRSCLAMNSGTGSVTYFFLATLDTEKLASFHTDSQGSWLSIRTGLERVGEVAVEATMHPFFVG